MSHLTILPTLLRSLERLEACLIDEGFRVSRPGVISGFADQAEPVDLVAIAADGHQLAWKRSTDGTLSLIGDLARLSTQPGLSTMLRRITRAYALRQALSDLDPSFSSARVTLATSL